MPNEDKKAAKAKMKAKAAALKESIKASKAKVQADRERNAQLEAQRQARFQNDANAANAVRQMTTPQGYDSDPLRGRGPQPSTKKKLDKGFKPYQPPKFK